MNNPFDDEVRAALHAEADGVHAEPELLERIRSGSRQRSAWRARAPWVAAVAAVAFAVGVAAVVLAGGDGDQSLDVVDDSTSSTTERPGRPPQLPPALCQGDEGIELAVYLIPGVSNETLAAMAQRLDADPRVASADYSDQQEVYAEFLELFADSPNLVDTVTPDILPPRYGLTFHDAADRDAVAADLEGATGVYEIVDAQDVCGEPDLADRPVQAVAVNPQGHVVVIDTSTGAVIRDLGGFDDPTDPAVADREGGAYSITGVALHPNGRDVYFETCCEPAAGAIFRVPIDGSVSIDTSRLVPVAFGFGIDISADGRWLAYASPAGPGLRDLATGEEVYEDAGNGFSDLVQVAVNADGTEVTVERALDYRPGEAPFYVVRSELITFRRDGDALTRGETTGGDVRLLPIYSNGGTELTTVAARDGLIDLNTDATGRWFLATPHEMPLRGYSEASDEQEISGTYVAADW